MMIFHYSYFGIHNISVITDNCLDYLMARDYDIAKLFRSRIELEAYIINMQCKIVFNFALRHDLALLQDNRLLA